MKKSEEKISSGLVDMRTWQVPLSHNYEENKDYTVEGSMAIIVFISIVLLLVDLILHLFGINIGLTYKFATVVGVSVLVGIVGFIIWMFYQANLK